MDAKPDAVDFYTRFGFKAVEVTEGGSGARPEPVAMFVPLDLIKAAFA